MACDESREAGFRGHVTSTIGRMPAGTNMTEVNQSNGDVPTVMPSQDGIHAVLDKFSSTRRMAPGWLATNLAKQASGAM